jgi:hypothetical protein
MPTKTPASVAEYLDTLPDDRRKEIERVRKVLRKNLPKGYEEAFSSAGIVYQIPLKRYADTYNGHPLWLAALAARKNYLTLHLMPVYGDSDRLRDLQAGFKSEGKKLDMGKACIRFKTADDLALDTIGEIVAKTPVDEWIEIAESAKRR